MSINTNSYGVLNKNYVKRIQETITKALNDYPRLMVLRVDLRLPEIETGTYKSDSGIVTRFIVSLKSQIEADLLKNIMRGSGFTLVMFVISGRGSLMSTGKNIITWPYSLIAKHMLIPNLYKYRRRIYPQFGHDDYGGLDSGSGTEYSK